MSDETKNVLNHLASTGPLANATVTNKNADAIMLQTGGNIMSRGSLYDIKCDKLSPGVCRLSLKKVT